MSMTTESEERMIAQSNSLSSPSTDDGNSSGQLKKGPWTSAEDAILVDYVLRHGEGNWNAVQKHSGLSRCGKSCRLRWANHLRPDLKKCAFTPEEERRIIELHSKMGNKWARMAAELPGRTDNEIKNFWNTRIKRRQRAGLPIYPPDIPVQSEPNTLPPVDGPPLDFLPVNNTFKGLGFNQNFHHPQTLSFSDIPSQGFFNPSSSNKSLVSTFHQSKRLCGPDPLFGNGFYGGSQLYQSDCTVQISKSFVFSQNDQNPNFDYTSNVYEYELPSLQTQAGNVGQPPSPPLPFFESVDILIQTPPTEHGSSSSCHLSPNNRGLLEDVLYESETMKSNHVSPHVHNETKWSHLDEPNLVEDLPVKEAASGFDPIKYDDKVEAENQFIISRPDYLFASNCLSPSGNENTLVENAMGKFVGEDVSKDRSAANGLGHNFVGSSACS